MTSNKTPEEDFKRFEDWIDGMEDKEFEYMMDTPEEDGGFSDKQKKLASEIREEATEEDLEGLVP